METKYTYQALGFVNLTSFAFIKSYQIPGILDSTHEVIIMGVLTQGEYFNKQSNLYTLLGISRPGVTMIITNMIKKGLITQNPDPEDHRGYILNLTPYGKKIAAWMIYKTKTLNQIQLDGLTKEEIKTYNRLSLKMAENMLDISNRELLNLPKFDPSSQEYEWEEDSENDSFISKEDRIMLFKLEKNTNKIGKNSTNLPL